MKTISHKYSDLSIGLPSFFDKILQGMKLTASKLQAMAHRIVQADVNEVVKRIERRVPSPYKREELETSVKTFDKTKDPRDDITLQDSKLLYPSDEMGDSFDLQPPHGQHAHGKDREVDVDWTSHAQYRSELRDVDANRVNTEIRDMLERMPNYRTDQKVKLQKPFGTAVVELDGRRPSDVEADVITVWK